MKYLARRVIIKGDDGMESIRHLQYIDINSAGEYSLRDFDRERPGYSFIDEFIIPSSGGSTL